MGWAEDRLANAGTLRRGNISMHRRLLGRSSVHVAPVVIGGNVFGWTADARASFDILDRFLDRGFNTIDTADSYSAWAPGNSGGESETIIGDWISSRGNRSKVTLITKVGYPPWREPPGLSPKNVKDAIEGSLRRLRTDYVDVYFSHWPDENTPHTETLDAYQTLIDQGKIRCCGASNFSIDQLRTALQAPTKDGRIRYEVIQPEYNLCDRETFDGELRELCLTEGIGAISYSSLASGFLTGKYKSESDMRAAPRGDSLRKYNNPRCFGIVSVLHGIADRHGVQPSEVALAWVIAQPGVTAPIASATTTWQADAIVAATELTLTVEDLAELESVSANQYSISQAG
jgi:aryl-alcohol dehydrogenase-like predicted oxidoreductase